MPVYLVWQNCFKKKTFSFLSEKNTYILDKYCFYLEKWQDMFMQLCIMPITTPVTCSEFTVHHSILGLFAL